MTVIQSGCMILSSVLSPELTCHFNFLHKYKNPGKERKRVKIPLCMGVIKHDIQLIRFQDYLIDNIS